MESRQDSQAQVVPGPHISELYPQSDGIDNADPLYVTSGSGLIPPVVSEVFCPRYVALGPSEPSFPVVIALAQFVC